MANKKILTVEEQKHLALTLPTLFQDLDTDDLAVILAKLGLDQIVDEEGNVVPKYSLDIKSDKPVFITKDYNIKLTGTLYNFYDDNSSKITSWQWSRNSGNTSEDIAWSTGKTTREIELTESDFTPRFKDQDIVFNLTAKIDTLEFTDAITFSKFQTFSKVQIQASNNVFVESTPSSILLQAITEESVENYSWYIDNNLVGVGQTYNLTPINVPLKGVVNIKLEVVTTKGDTLTDTMSISRLSNGTDAEPGVPGPPGSSSYTWIRYADDENGLNMSEYPIVLGVPKEYIGLAPNRNTPTESNNPLDYTWSKYIGDQGVPGESILNAFVFKRSATVPAVPTGGTFLNPIPTGWSDGIPEESNGNPVWMSTRIFTLSGNAPQTDWSVPEITSDTATIDFDWCSSDVVDPGTPDAPLNGAIWNETSDITNIWMAIQRIVNGERQPWEIKRIKGEKGQPSFMWVKYSEFPLGRNLIGQPEMYDTPFILEPGPGGTQVREDMVYMGIAYNKTTAQEPPANTTEGAPEQYTWAKVRGEDGRTPYIIDLSNDNVSVPANADGTISNPAVSFSLAKTDITVYYGNEPVDRSQYNFEFTASTGVSYSTSDSNHKIQLVGFTQDIGEIKIKVMSKETTPREITSGTFSVIKVKGTAIYEIFPSVSIIKVLNIPGQTAQVIPASIEADVFVNNGNIVEETLLGKLTYKYIYANTPSGSTDDGTQITLGQSIEVSNAGNPLFLEFKYFHPTNGLLVDVERIPFVRDGVSGTSVEQRYQKNSDSLSPPALTVTQEVPTNWTIAIPSTNAGEVVWMTKAIKTGDTGLLVGTWSSPIRVSGGAGSAGPIGPSGPPGINGTTGPIPRLVEFVQGAEYTNGGKFIDFAYYRTTDPAKEGWYYVKLPTDHVAGTEVKKIYTGGIPSTTDFIRDPFFSKEASFGRVIAEEANIAGFIFRNQALHSQEGTPVAECHPFFGTPQSTPSNLSLDGLSAIIKFLDKMILDPSGITLKDDCGKPRIEMKWDAGIPILRFLKADGSIQWSAGESGYVYITTGTTQPSWSSPVGFRRIENITGGETAAFDEGGANYTAARTFVRNHISTSPNSNVNVTPHPVTGTGDQVYFMSNAFPTTTWYNETAKSGYSKKYSKGDITANEDKINGYYIQEIPVTTVPNAGLLPDGWYLTGAISGTNGFLLMNTTVSISPTEEEVEFFSEIGYFKDGNLLRKVPVSVHTRTIDRTQGA